MTCFTVGDTESYDEALLSEEVVKKIGKRDDPPYAGGAIFEHAYEAFDWLEINNQIHWSVYEVDADFYQDTEIAEGKDYRYLLKDSPIIRKVPVMSYNQKHLEQTHISLVSQRHGGLHLIMPILKKIAYDPIVEIGKLPFLKHEPNGPVVKFTRDPRDIIIARYRWRLRKNGLSIDPPENFGHDMLIASMMTRRQKPRDRNARELHTKNFVEGMLVFFSHWMPIEGLSLKFEDLADEVNGPGEVVRICEFLGVEADAQAIFDSVFKTGPTYTGSFSKWREWFGPICQDMFSESGGDKLLEVMDYEQ